MKESMNSEICKAVYGLIVLDVDKYFEDVDQLTPSVNLYA